MKQQVSAAETEKYQCLINAFVEKSSKSEEEIASNNPIQRGFIIYEVV